MADLMSVSQGCLFDSLKQSNPDGLDFWSARDLQSALGYALWRNFASAIERAQLACKNTGCDVDSNFYYIESTMSRDGATPSDYQLSRYACYLVAMNSDPSKPEVALAQSYFAIRTHQAEQMSLGLSEDNQWATVKGAGNYLDRIRQEAEIAIQLASAGELALQAFQEIRQTPKLKRGKSGEPTRQEKEIEFVISWMLRRGKVGKELSASEVLQNCSIHEGNRLNADRIREAFAELERRGFGTISHRIESDPRTQRFTLSHR